VTTYIIKRIVQLVIVLVIVTVLVFVGMRALPGDPIRMLVTRDQLTTMTPERIEQLRHEAGLDRNVAVQYFTWVGGLFKGDMGKSILYKTPVSDQILRRLPITLHIGLLGWIIGTLLGVGAGILCAVKRGTWVDTAVTSLANAGTTVPIFWLALVLVYIFALWLPDITGMKWLPVQGYTSPFEDFWLNLRQIIMPVVCIALFPMASTCRQTRSALLGVLRQDYIRTAWSKGLGQRAVILRHALKNSLIPIVTLSGMGLSMVVGGEVFVETVFNIPGIGRLAVQAVQNQDYPYIQAIALVVAAVVLTVNLLVDISYGWLDPRIRYS
jgi:peptide/nickel transport system permease protein